MKHIKRFLSSILALAMVMSLSAVAFAAEADVSTIPADTEMVLTADDNQAVSPQADVVALTDFVEAWDVQTGQDFSGYFNEFSGSRYATIVLRCEAPCTVNVYNSSNVLLGSKFLSGGGRYSIALVHGRNLKYSVHFHGNSGHVLFQFLGTTNSYWIPQ